MAEVSETGALEAGAGTAQEAEPAPSKDPTLDFEQRLFAQGYSYVIGIDEVGRGAIAGPVAVGAHAIPLGTTEFPTGLRDSKLLSEKKRDALAPLVADWGTGAVGYGSAEEIDQRGITTMLGEAARRALLKLNTAGIPVDKAAIILDGAHDWLTPVLRAPLDIRTLVGGDRSCASVAAASVNAKVARDALMREADEAMPGYSWASNKGYGAKAHYAGITEFGVTEMHRRTWIK